ncbi:tRNA (cytidine56-2'-O)-methyltransferase [Methanofollis sp. W23]|uniref:tRNA (cytidine(56)-2'-O)-methyltransferase n=1 Tax=Methanofollis sp. W23 TaxID=2817849 RepID=UPI001AE173A2|nr:tRNA (cytidine(56)-2'-O)-methyltransferase [Methanofollis sp. W23]MBP2145591.1 tRNA (cytidine56-2'-O)-methyltransferase [Methanofollis sp. W23]MDD3620868.1 tRNA (cytidine(56)-2'-O)-methyltransferase [Methanofollis sp.]
MRKVCILRLGHRPERDHRVTTHVGLTARALGADGMYLAGEDPVIVGSVRDVVERWGGEFFIEDKVKWKQCIRRWKENGGIVAHLTMYGLEVGEVVAAVQERPEDLLIIVGAEKVPGDVYGMVDYNVSVTNQPHSEISSLAIFLDRLFMGQEMEKKFEGAKIRVEPCEAGKRVIEQ